MPMQPDVVDREKFLGYGDGLGSVEMMANLRRYTF